MKKLIGFVVTLVIGFTTFGQSEVLFTDAGASYDKSAVTAFHFHLGSDFTAEQIQEAATYYTDYYTVEKVAADGGLNITITLNEDTEMARRVISRFFITLQVSEITAASETLSVHDFVDTYIML